mmetsp:Transcript_35852/g.73075  ORF Transcript_35852/g.73075 Transcript_35852/m.73075 type:complete len:95 (-) Transcript_35852:1294-1578(-)
MQKWTRVSAVFEFTTRHLFSLYSSGTIFKFESYVLLLLLLTRAISPTSSSRWFCRYAAATPFLPVPSLVLGSGSKVRSKVGLSTVASAQANNSS